MNISGDAFHAVRMTIRDDDLFIRSVVSLSMPRALSLPLVIFKRQRGSQTYIQNPHPVALFTTLSCAHGS